jgi:hypothetical protein
VRESYPIESTPQGEPAGLPAHHDDGESAKELVTSMAHDVRHLGEQYLELIKLEVAKAVATIRRELVKRLIAGGALAIGALFLVFTLLFLATDELGWPRWLACGVLALCSIAAGAVTLLTSGKESRP